MKKLFLLASAIFSLNTFSQVPNYVPTNGLVAWYPYNGSANDASGNSNNATVIGATLTTDRFGNSNTAYSFDGTSNFIVMPSSLNPPQLSISFWCKLNSNQVDQTIIRNRLYGYGVSYNLTPNTEKFSANLYLNSTNSYSAVVNDSISLSKWYNIVFIYDGNNYKIYVDGVSIYQSNSLGAGSVYYGNSGNGFAIGRDGDNAARYFNGSIDDIGIWNRALTQQEITTLYNATSCANNTTISPQTNSLTTGSTAVFTATTTDPNPSYVWQSDLGQGFQTLNNYGAYSGVNTSNLSISNVQLANHLQPIRVIATSGTCIDTSNVATITISDTCIVTINDTITTLISVTDTLIINSTITSLMPPNNTNTIKVFPNPTNDHITINYGNFAAMNGYTLKITNTLGQVVFTSPINQQISYLDLSTWGGNGIYFIQIINTQNNTIENRKIVLQ